MLSQNILDVSYLTSFPKRAHGQPVTTFAVRVAENTKIDYCTILTNDLYTHVQWIFFAPFPTVKQSSPFTT